MIDLELPYIRDLIPILKNSEGKHNNNNNKLPTDKHMFLIRWYGYTDRNLEPGGSAQGYSGEGESCYPDSEGEGFVSVYSGGGLC